MIIGMGSDLCNIERIEAILARFGDRFRNRVHLVDQAAGFIRNEVHRPRPVRFDHEQGGFVDDPEAEGYYEVKTWWVSMDDFANWTRSPAFAEAHPDSTTDDDRWECVDIKAVRPLTQPVTLEMCKGDERLSGMVLINNSRLSVQPVTEAEWRVVCELGRTEP